MESNTLQTLFFPNSTLRLARNSAYPNIVTLGLGANLSKNNPKVLAKCIAKFSHHRQIDIVQISPILRNPPFGYINQPFFYNCVIELRTTLNLVEFYGLIFYIERCFGRGRKREFKNAPRYLDIDIIFFNDFKIRRKYLNIPHIAWDRRLSVGIPLSFLY